jgi:hypothetical protein
VRGSALRGLAWAAARAHGAGAPAAAPRPQPPAPAARAARAPAPPVLQHAHPHRVLPGREHAGHAERRATPRRARREIGLQPYRDEPLRRLRLARPLDFAAVTDHAEQLGEVSICRDPAQEGYGAWICRLYRGWPRAAFFLMNTKASFFAHPTRFAFCGERGERCLAAAGAVWREIQAAAEGAYDRSPACRFTSFVGYEWTGASGARNLHRTVIFRGERVPALPSSYFETHTPQALWRALRRDCLDAGSGCDACHSPTRPLRRAHVPPLEEDSSPSARPARANRRSSSRSSSDAAQGDSECGTAGASPRRACALEAPYDAFGGKYFRPRRAAPRGGRRARRSRASRRRRASAPALLRPRREHHTSRGRGRERGTSHGGAGARSGRRSRPA